MVDRFDWSPEPDLLDIRDPGRSRPSLEALGEATWREALDWLYDHAMERPVHGQAYPEARETFFGPSRQPVAAPMSPTTSDKVLAEFRARVAPWVE